MTWQPVDRATLLDRTGGDPYVELAVRPDAFAVAGKYGWAVLHPWRPTGHRGGCAVVAADAPQEAETTALTALLTRAPETLLEWFSTVPGGDLHAPAGFAVAGSRRWDFLSTRAEPTPVEAPDGIELVEKDDTGDAAEPEAFGRAHNASFEGFPGRGFSVLWLAATDATGTLVGSGAMHVLTPGAPHLSGLVVDPAHQGRGIGALLSAELTRRAIRRSGASTLGVYSDNRAAIGLYYRLGYRTHHSFHTRVLVAG